MNSSYQKYIKYKNKYLNLKEKINKMKGGNLSNLKNILVMGAGPIGLINTLALINRYPYNVANDADKSSCIDGNNIFLIGKDNPWRPQIFFLQNSFREYNSADFIRDIDLETYRHLEQIGCYIGSPPSTMSPYCFSAYKIYNPLGESDTPESDYPIYAPSRLAQDISSIRAPSQIKPNDTSKTSPLYLMNHLSFHTADLEIILLNRLLQINDENIEFYLRQKIDDSLNTEIETFINKYTRILNEELCSKSLLKALIIKDHLIKTGKIDIKDFLPLVILLHPLNKYCYYNSYVLFKYYNLQNEITNTYLKKTTEDFFISSLKTEYISDDDINNTGNGFTNLWEPKKTKSGDIYLEIKSNNEATNSKYSFNEESFAFCKKQEICTDRGDFIFLNNIDYDIVFEAEARNKQFGRTDDYYYLQNRKEFDICKKVEIDITPFIGIILNKNNVINIVTESENKIYLILNKTITQVSRDDISYIVLKFDIVELTDGTDILKMNIVPDRINFMIMEIPISRIPVSLSDAFNLVTNSGRNVEQIFTTNLQNPEESKIKETINILDLLDKITDLELKMGDVKVNKLYKINTLAFEEKPFDLKKSKVNDDAIVFASVWMFNAVNEIDDDDNINKKNKMFYGKYGEDDLYYKTLTKSDGQIINDIPLSSGDLISTDSYTKSFEKTKKIRERVDKLTMPNQVYINNDQVQYFNNSINALTNLGGNTKGLIHQNGIQPSFQHVFRVFGVNLHKEKFSEKITNPNLRGLFNMTTNKKFYYNGIQISSELNEISRSIKKDDDIDFKKNIIFKNLFILAMLYSQHNSIINVDNFNKELYDLIQKEWTTTYAKEKPKTFDGDAGIIENPINETFKNIFPIVLRYKLNTIEKDEDTKKLVFNLGDSNTTVNFFSGTGLNTGISNIKKILTDYRSNLQDSEIAQRNEEYKNSNRRTIYNSLLSSQNPSVLSVERKFSCDDPKNKYGPFIQNISKKPITEIDVIINTIIEKDGISNKIDHENHPIQYNRIENLINLLKKFSSFYEYFLINERLGFDVSQIDKDDYHLIYKALKWNLFVCLYNLITNPVLNIGSYENEDYNRESITYLNNMIYNYFDFCNFNIGDNPLNNQKYHCDILSTEPGTYNPKRSEGVIRTGDLTT
jgi:hypothetical protein